MKWLPDTTKDRTALAISIVLSLLLWGSFQMSKTREVELFVRTKFVPASGFTIAQPPPKKVYLKIAGNGWSLLALRPAKGDTWVYRLPKQREVILSERAIRDLIRKYFHISGAQIKSVAPAPMVIRQDEENKVTIPIKAKVQAVVPQNFLVSGPISFVPDSITLYGPSGQLKELDKWVLEDVSLSQVQDHHLIKHLALPPSNHAIRRSTDSLLITVPIEEATEKQLRVPVRYDSIRYHFSKVFPSKVDITLMTPLSLYDHISSEDITLTFQPDTSRHYTTYPIIVTRLPAYTKLLSVSPDYVEVYFK